MTNVEFVEETNNLEKFFDKDLKDFERAIWFRELKDIDVARYRQIVKEAYRQCKFMPKLADIIKINNDLPKTKIKKEEKEHVKCNVCKNRRIHNISKNNQKWR